MQIETYLEKYQPAIYKTFVNALSRDKLSHAYLLSGAPGMPLKDIAMYLAKSILCDDRHPLACNNCITCMRIDEGNYADILVFGDDGNKIKKGDVDRIISNFDKTALEDKGIMIYILNGVETMTNSAVNALLKFLEEPGKNIYAFLTTENESKVLPTILSRTQVLKLRPINQQTVINEAINDGVMEDDAQILSGFYNDTETIKKTIESPVYQSAKTALDDQLNALLISPSDAVFTCEKLVIPVIKTPDAARFYIRMLILVFQDLVNLKAGGEIVLKYYETILNELAGKLSHLDKSLLMIMSAMSKLDLNVNVALLLDHIIYEITKEEE